MISAFFQIVPFYVESHYQNIGSLLVYFGPQGPLALMETRSHQLLGLLGLVYFLNGLLVRQPVN